MENHKKKNEVCEK